ncbi:hypothetical protein MY04_0851 [Flammeovirga sp. MY04]|uniref:hypothetical protein n=1 Tax=Flammeovirga sp. MY04 TaxID=1191459 RepID=UPI0008062C84|nr:hypothetical protein [Flammeovirga sp. MY04]ANQ48233.1 hypothetical protein MY04_0851 [Flammeovirga sp. MY04]
MYKILYILLFLFHGTIFSQTYPSLSNLKKQKQLLLQQQLEDSLLQTGEIPQIIAFVGGRVGLVQNPSLLEQQDLSTQESWEVSPYLTTGLSFTYKRWELDALFGLNVSINSESRQLDISDRWLAESKVNYRLEKKEKGSFP